VDGETRSSEMTLGTMLLIVLVLALLGVIPSWPHSRGWGYWSDPIGLTLAQPSVNGESSIASNVIRVKLTPFLQSKCAKLFSCPRNSGDNPGYFAIWLTY